MVGILRIIHFFQNGSGFSKKITFRKRFGILKIAWFYKICASIQKLFEHFKNCSVHIFVHSFNNILCLEVCSVFQKMFETFVKMFVIQKIVFTNLFLFMKNVLKLSKTASNSNSFCIIQIQFRNVKFSKRKCSCFLKCVQ